jgi:2-polyprenyl-6-methoxyphenol hydroxylase-like FAD-dependent oxidoreductase
MEPMKVLIAGGGVGGLTLAAALRRAGVEARVFERATEFRPVGAGITMQANAIVALRSLGIGVELEQAGLVPREMTILDARGRVLARTDIEALNATVGAPVVCIHRARLHELLLRHAGESCVHRDSRVIDFRQDPGRVVVTLESGREEEGDLLVGADGLHSAVRARLLGDEQPRYAGYSSWRGVCSIAGVEMRRDRASESWGRGARFGVVPIGDELVYWFATANAPADERLGAAAERERLRALFAGWHSPIGALIEQTEDRNLLRTDITDRQPVDSWTRGRVTLLGDAAHPMTPNLGQGGCQAVEDAVVLARALAEVPDLASALASYERRRVRRANAIVMQSRKMGEVGQWESALACSARNVLLRLVPATAFSRRVASVMRFPA